MNGNKFYHESRAMVVQVRDGDTIQHVLDHSNKFQHNHSVEYINTFALILIEKQKSLANTHHAFMYGVEWIQHCFPVKQTLMSTISPSHHLTISIRRT